MKDYHFQENDQDFGLTVRLDDINEKVKQLKNDTIDDELGDANDFLNAFESEKFDTPAENFVEEEEVGDTIQPASVQKKAEPILEKELDEEEWEEADTEEGAFGLSKKTATLLAALGVIACILGFSLVRCGFHPSSAPAEVSGDACPMLVQSVLEGEEAVVYDITEGERRTLLLTDETKVIDEMGRSVAYGGVEMGDLVMVEMDKDGETALSIDYSSAAIQTQ